MAQKLNSAKTDISRTLQDLKVSDERLASKKASLKQIEDMENADEIRTLMGKSPQPPSTVHKKKQNPDKRSEEPSEKGGFFGRFFRKAESNVHSAKPQLKDDVKTQLTASKTNKSKGNLPNNEETKNKDSKNTEAVIVKKAKDIKKQAENEPTKQRTALKAEPVNVKVATVEDLKSSVTLAKSESTRMNSWLLLGVATIGLASLGAAYAFSFNGSSPVLTEHEPTSNEQIVGNETVLVADASNAVEYDINDQNNLIAQQKVIDNNSEIESVLEISKESEAVEIDSDNPLIETGPIHETVQNPEENLQVSNKPAANSDTPSPVKANPPRRVATQVQNVDYQIAIRQVQEELRYLGFYNGNVNGQQSVETQNAMRDFKAIYGLPVNNVISGDFLNALKRAADDQRQALAIQASETTSVEQAVKVAENIPAPVQFSEPITVIANEADLSLPQPTQDPVGENISTGSIIEESSPTDVEATIIPQEEQEEVLSAEIVKPSESTVPSLVDDNIIPAKITRKPRVEYPDRLLRLNKFYDVKVYVAYDVNTDGRVENAQVEKIDYDGEDRFKAYFEKEAVRAVERQRFEPRLVNGDPALETGRTTRISFKATEE